MKKTKNNTHTHNRPEHMTFADLQVGDHFLYGNREHVRIPIVDTGDFYDTPTKRAPSDCVPNRVILGYCNAAQLGSGQVSGFGPKCEVVKIHHEKKDYNGFFFE